MTDKTNSTGFQNILYISQICISSILHIKLDLCLLFWLSHFTKTDHLKIVIRIEYFVSLGKSQLSFCCHCLVAGPPLTNLSLPWIISRKKAILQTFFFNCMTDNTYYISGLTQEDRHFVFQCLEGRFLSRQQK